MSAEHSYELDEFNQAYRKNPPRARKKSRYFDDYFEPSSSYRPRIVPSHRPHIPEEELPQKIRKPHKMHKSMGRPPWHAAAHNPERRMSQVNAVRLRNVLKLPKAHKWVFYEWFYSNLDRPLLLGENDFRICLRENFPNVKTRNLSRAHWSLLRRLMGKPRRCSTAFFDEERRSLNEKREKIRTLQATRSVQLEYLRDLPDDMHVPMPLIIGTKITARVRYPTDGLYTGKVDAIDSLRHCYRVTFDKPTLGTRSIPDYEVLSLFPQETIPLSAYKTQHKASRNLFMSPARLLAQSALQGKRHHMHHHKLLQGYGGSAGPGAAGDVAVHDCPLCQAEASGTGGATVRTTISSGFGSNSNLLSAPLKLPAISSGDVAASMGSAALSLNEPSSGGRLLLNEADIYGGYPMKFLVMVPTDSAGFMHQFTSSHLQCTVTYPSPQTIGERNCGSYNHCTTSTRLLQLMVMNSSVFLSTQLPLADLLRYISLSFNDPQTKLSKILEVKKRCVDELQDLNDEAERKISNKTDLSLEFQHTYLTLVVHLERLNKELNQYLAHVLQYANEIAQEHGVAPLEQASDFKQRCDEDSYEIVSRMKNIQSQRLQNTRNMDLISKLVGLLVQVRSLTEQEGAAYGCSSIQDALREIKASVHPSNLQVFENSVEICAHHILCGLCSQSNLHAFLYMHPNHMQYI